MMKRLAATVILLPLLSGIFLSCEKEIELPYRSIDPIYVIAGYVTPGNSRVSVNATRNMEAGTEQSIRIPDALVTVTVEGKEYPFTLAEDSLYRPSEDFKEEIGKTYSLKVRIGGIAYSADSMLPDSVSIDTAGFRSLPVLTYKTWLYSAKFRDLPGEQYYASYLFCNGKLFRWDLSPDFLHEESVVPVDFPIESDEEAATGIAPHPTIVEGDSCRLEIRTVDRQAYDYLYSVALTMFSYSNPIPAFRSEPADAPQALGYFSAYSSSSRSTVFHRN